MPNSHSLPDLIQAAASGRRDSLLHLVVVIFTAAKSALASLCQHYQSHPRALTLENLVRIKYCAVRLQAIFHTLRHAPERFFTPAQLRALTRVQSVLARLWRQPVDFSPFTPMLTAPEACPPPPRYASCPASSSGTPSESESSSVPAASLSALRAPHSALSSSDPLLLRSPGCALAAVLLHIAAMYGISTHPAPKPRSSSASSASPQSSVQATISNSATTPVVPPAASCATSSPQSSIHNPQSPPFRPPP